MSFSERMYRKFLVNAPYVYYNYLLNSGLIEEMAANKRKVSLSFIEVMSTFIRIQRYFN